MNYLAPSLLACDFAKLGEEIKIISDGGAQYIHIDVMDGLFVPSISFGMPVIKSIRKCTDHIFDVHLMIEEPQRYIEAFAQAGADIITVHAESCRHLDRVIHQIHETGKKAGIALNPATSLTVLEHILPDADMILIMTVNPGFGGQKYIPYCTQKVRDLRELIERKGLTTDIEVDGGITLQNVSEVLEAGANVVVAGTSVFKGDAKENVAAFLKKMEVRI
ncbi:MAG: ribulose-phosphate 3-epimerase [Lachnospiraceae bacterium]